LEQFVKAKMIEHAPSPLYTNWGNMVATVVSFPKRMKELQPTSSIVNRTLSSLIVLTKLTSTTFIRWLIKRAPHYSGSGVSIAEVTGQIWRLCLSWHDDAMDEVYSLFWSSSVPLLL